MPWLCVGYLLGCLLFSGVASSGWFRLTSRLWGSVHLRPFVFFLDSFFFLAGSQARWSYPRNHYYLCYASLLALAMPMLRCLPFAFKPPKLPCQTSNPPCPSKPLIGYVTALLSPSYSVASCRWRLEAVPCWNMFIVGISLLYLVYFKCTYILGKGWKTRPFA